MQPVKQKRKLFKKKSQLPILNHFRERIKGEFVSVNIYFDNLFRTQYQEKASMTVSGTSINSFYSCLSLVQQMENLYCSHELLAFAV